MRLMAFSALAALSFTTPLVRAADHGDAPTVAHDQACDLADVYFFLDPNDNTKAIIIGTFHGFIVPGEASNFAIFDPTVRYHFEIYNDHVNLPADQVNAKKIKANKTIDVTFSPRVGGPDPSAVSGKEALEIPFKQTASIQLTGFEGIDKKTQFTADCLNPSLSATSPTQADVVKEISPGIKFFAGEVDDPFFFDIPGFSRLIGSIRAGSTNPATLNRGRDTFAGYNILSIAMSIPVSALKGTGNKIGIDLMAQRHQVEQPQKDGTVKGIGAFKNVDRMGNPAVNVVLVPFSQKNSYNASTPKDDASGKFVNDLAATIGALGLGTNDANVGLLVNTAVTYGDLLTLDTSVLNTGNGGGDVAGAGFPNGRRLQDDVVDTLIAVLTNFGVTTGDHVNGNDVAFGNTFPFLAPTQQPRDRVPADPALPDTNVDDNTRN